MDYSAHRPFSPTIWDEAETWSRDRIAAHQLAALKKQLAHVGQASAHYADVFREAGFQPGDFRSLDDLRKLPVFEKSDYVAGLEKAPPLGTFAANAARNAVRMHFSSGTTGRPTPVLWTRNDLARWADLYARFLYAQGLRAGDVFQCMFNYAWFVGGLGATAGAERVGALVIPGSAGDSKRQIDSILHYGTRAVIGTPSFMAHLAETAREMGVDLTRSTVEMVCVGGEPGASVPGTRARLEELWGAKVFDCYGALECQPIGWESAAQLGPQIAEDFVFVEILDAATREPVPDGTPGVLVLTHLDKEACPLVRWWTGDIVVRDSTPTADGRTHARLAGGVKGRADDMLIIRGVNLFPTAVEDIIRSCEGTTNEFQIVLDDSVRDHKTGFLTGLKLRVEASGDAPSDFSDRISRRLRDELKVRFDLEILPAGALPRATHKAKRVVQE